MVDAADPAEFRARVRAKYSAEFALHRDVAEALEATVGANRSLPTHVHVALDMLMTQAYKSHFAVRLMAERAHAEDAATLTRRLMELAVQAMYIGGGDDPTIVAKRAGLYLAWLWREAQDTLKAHVPESAQQQWREILLEYGPQLPKGKRWGTTFKEMFAEVELLDAYEQDYSLLSAIAHGSAQESVFHYSMPIVDLRSHKPVPVLLIFASRYYLGVAEAWNRHFAGIDPAVMTSLVERVVGLRDAAISPRAT